MTAMNWSVVQPEIWLLTMACVVLLVDLFAAGPQRRNSLQRVIAQHLTQGALNEFIGAALLISPCHKFKDALGQISRWRHCIEIDVKLDPEHAPQIVNVECCEQCILQLLVLGAGQGHSQQCGDKLATGAQVRGMIADVCRVAE